MKKFFLWSAALLAPVALIFLALRLMLTPLFVQSLYWMPNIPPDPYGFTRADRLKWSAPSVRYLMSDDPISALEALRFEDGTPIFTPRELRHMEDVKILARRALVWGYAALSALILLGLAARSRNGTSAFRQGLKRGGWLTLGILGALILLASLDFWSFFADFHHLFFQGDSWLFEYSDTLIRLFPIPFWEDAFAFAALIVAGGALGLAFGIREEASGV